MCLDGKCRKMEKADPGIIVVIPIGAYFAKAAKEAVIEQNGYLVVPQINSDKTAE